MDIPHGVSRWTTKQGVTVVRVHYTADHDKRSEEWRGRAEEGNVGGNV